MPPISIPTWCDSNQYPGQYIVSINYVKFQSQHGAILTRRRRYWSDDIHFPFQSQHGAILTKYQVLDIEPDDQNFNPNMVRF